MSVDFRLRFNFSIFPFLITILKVKWPDFVKRATFFFRGGGLRPLAPGRLRPCIRPLKLSYHRIVIINIYKQSQETEKTQKTRKFSGANPLLPTFDDYACGVRALLIMKWFRASMLWWNKYMFFYNHKFSYRVWFLVKIKHQAKQWLRPSLKFAYQLNIFLKFQYSAVLNKLIGYSY